MRRGVVLAVAAVCVCLFAMAGVAATTECISDGFDAEWPIGGLQPNVSLSADGRYVAFSQGYEIYVRDRAAGTAQRISLDYGESEDGWHGCAFHPAMSADGRFVTFLQNTEATCQGLYLWDRQRGVAKPIIGGLSRKHISVEEVAISGNGRYLAFSTWDSLLPVDRGGRIDVYVWDRVTRGLSLESVNSRGQKGNGDSDCMSISRDGRFIAFVSQATNLVAGDTIPGSDVFLRDRLLRKTKCVSRGPDGAPCNRAWGVTSVSDDGRYVSFVVEEGVLQVYVRDRRTGALELVSADPSGQPAGIGCGFAARMSGNGRFVIFTSRSTNLVPEQPIQHINVFVRDRLTQTTQLVSVSATGALGNGGCDVHPNLALSADGTCAAFASDSTNLTEEGTGGYFVRSGIEWPALEAAPGSPE